jgi:drug/metabolite transporter (DMT)-like permease
MLVSGTPFFGYPTEVWVLFAAMTAGPQFLGHTVINHLLGELKASIVSVALLAEAVGATVLAFVVFGERPGARVVLGGAIVLAGVAITVLAEADRRPEVLAMPEE